MIPLDPQAAVEQKAFTAAEASILITFPALPLCTHAFSDSLRLFFSFNVQVMLRNLCLLLAVSPYIQVHSCG